MHWTAMHSLMPPKDLIVQNGIGASGQKDVHEEFHEIGYGLIAEMVRDGFIKPGHSSAGDDTTKWTPSRHCRADTQGTSSHLDLLGLKSCLETSDIEKKLAELEAALTPTSESLVFNTPTKSRNSLGGGSAQPEDSAAANSSYCIPIRRMPQASHRTRQTSHEPQRRPWFTSVGPE
jgi:hypothetical protein